MSKWHALVRALLLCLYITGVPLPGHAGEALFLARTDLAVVALTFDDGPRLSSTPKLLEILKREKVRATFFVVGRKAAEFPFLVQREHAAGHYVENHSYYHNDLTRLSRKNQLMEWKLCSDVVEKITGRRPLLGRPPGGRINESVIQSAREAGLTLALWTINTSDYSGRPAHEILATVRRKLQPGAVVLLHDALPNTVEALPGLIRLIRSMGYRIIPLEEMGSRACSYNRRDFHPPIMRPVAVK